MREIHVVSTLNADLQTTAYNSLGDRRGAVVVIRAIYRKNPCDGQQAGL